MVAPSGHSRWFFYVWGTKRLSAISGDNFPSMAIAKRHAREAIDNSILENAESLFADLDAIDK